MWFLSLHVYDFIEMFIRKTTDTERNRDDDGTKEQDAVAFVIVCASSDNSYHRHHQCFSDFRIETGIGLCVLFFFSCCL